MKEFNFFMIFGQERAFHLIKWQYRSSYLIYQARKELSNNNKVLHSQTIHNLRKYGSFLHKSLEIIYIYIDFYKDFFVFRLFLFLLSKNILNK